MTSFAFCKKTTLKGMLVFYRFSWLKCGMPFVFVILLITMFVLGTNGLVLAPVLSEISAGLSTNISNGAIGIAGYGFGTAVIAFLFGRSIDQIGLRKSLLIALCIAAIGQFLGLIVSSWVGLGIAQIIVGGASGIGIPAIYALTNRAAEPGRASARMALVLSGWSLGLILAIPIAALLADTFGWRSIFFVIGTSHLLLVPFLRFLPGPSQNEVSPSLPSRFAPLRAEGGIATFSICCCFMASFYGVYTFTGDFVVTQFDRPLAQTGLIALFYGIGFGAMAPLGRLFEGKSAAQFQVITLPVGIATYILIAIAPNFVLFLGVTILWGAINHFNLNLILKSVTALMPHAQGAGMGLYTTLTYLAATASALVFGQIYEGLGFAALAWSAAFLHLLAFGLAFYSAAREARLRSCGSK